MLTLEMFERAERLKEECTIIRAFGWIECVLKMSAKFL